jgi:son of sevenless
MYLSDMVHINDQYPDTINTDFGLTLIHFVKRERWADAMNAMLRFQKRPHPIAEDPMTMNFVEQQLSGGLAGARDPSYFWGRSQELQQAELAHADIRKGLEAAGF